MTYQEFCLRLEKLRVGAGVYSLVDAGHPLDIYCGYNDMLQPAFLIIGQEEINTKNVPGTQAISVTCARRHDGRYATSFVYMAGSNRDMFRLLCYDMLESSRAASADPLKCLLQRYLAWRRMFSGVRPDLLNEQEQKGLCGELLFLLEEIERIGAKDAVDSWMGPLDKDQDFITSDSWAEIKSVRLAAESVKISSLEQLAPTVPGLLVVYKIESTNAVEADRFSLYELIVRVQERICASTDACLTFYEKLSDAGCVPDEETYKNTFFVLKDKAVYEVREDFPKLDRAHVPLAVMSASYSLDLNLIDDFKREA